MEFSEKEVEEKLIELGYKDVPHAKLLEFMADLKEMMEHEQQVSQYASNFEGDSSWDSCNISDSKPEAWDSCNMSDSKPEAWDSCNISDSRPEVSGVEHRSHADKGVKLTCYGPLNDRSHADKGVKQTCYGTLNDRSHADKGVKQTCYGPLNDRLHADKGVKQTCYGTLNDRSHADKGVKQRCYGTLNDSNGHYSNAFSKEKLSAREDSFLDKENLKTYSDESAFLSSTIDSTDDTPAGYASGYQHHHAKHSSSTEGYTSGYRHAKHSSTRRKVARRKDGMMRVFDETLTDNESEAMDITEVEERIKFLPYNTNLSNESATSHTSSRMSRPNNLPAFIRPSSSHPHTKRIHKCDPVNRFHQFQEDWKQNKIPGESKRSSLRWNIREQMLNSVVYEKPQRNYKSNDYVVPTEKKRQALRWQVRTALSKI